jgi:alpha-2-macroglobulin
MSICAIRAQRDSGTNFFFEHLPQGEYTFKYRIRATTAGAFKVAPATVQPMYAPDFAAYSSGASITISGQ